MGNLYRYSNVTDNLLHKNNETFSISFEFIEKNEHISTFQCY